MASRLAFPLGTCEKKFEKKFREYLASQGAYVLPKVPARSYRGLPDVIWCLHGHFMVAELKKAGAPKKAHEALQRYECSKIMTANGIAFERVSPLNVKSVIQVINDIKKEFSNEQSGH